ncbi:SLC13 family permease [Pseudonocardia kongjuensis]|uniref:SLC13 family permease n=1 Tax=Pseudonocardia kongjuensis TaxID=102227 RepID=A0ABP4I7M2_9PSEU
MTTVDLVSSLLLLAVFVIGTTTKANIGALGLLASFLLGSLYLRDEDVSELLSGFPISLFLLLLGVTYLFSVAGSNGTMDWLVGATSTLVQGRGLAVPVGAYTGAVFLTALGAPSQAAIAVLAPVAIRLGRECGIPSFTTGLVILLGVGAGSFSPVNVLAIIANESLANGGIEPDPLGLFAGMVVGNTVIATAVVAVQAVLLRRRTPVEAARPVAVGVGGAGPAGIDRPDLADGPDRADDAAGTDTAGPARAPIDLPVACTLAGLAVVLVGALGLGFDLGALALGVGLLLHVLFPRPNSTDGIAWPIILLVCGLMTYIGVMQRVGTFDRLGDALGGIGSPLLAILVICLGLALISMFAASPAAIGTGVTLAIPLIAVGGLPATGVVIAICLSIKLTDTSPFSSVGALTVAATPEEDRTKVFRWLLAWGIAMIVIGPLLSMLFVVL